MTSPLLRWTKRSVYRQPLTLAHSLMNSSVQSLIHRFSQWCRHWLSFTSSLYALPKDSSLLCPLFLPAHLYFHSSSSLLLFYPFTSLLPLIPRDLTEFKLSHDSLLLISFPPIYLSSFLRCFLRCCPLLILIRTLFNMLNNYRSSGLFRCKDAEVWIRQTIGRNARDEYFLSRCLYRNW